jgi:hypothetical protein
MLGIEFFLHNKEWSIAEIKEMIISHIIRHEVWGDDDTLAKAVNALGNVLQAYVEHEDEEYVPDFVAPGKESEEIFIEYWSKAYAKRIGKDFEYGRESWPCYDFPYSLNIPKDILIESARICGDKDAIMTLQMWKQLKNKGA